jgi:hypothetical protein
VAWIVLLLQLLEPSLNVNGSPLPATRPPTRIGNEWFLPIVPIARTLGVQMEVTAGPVLRVRRLDGSEMTYDGRTGEIRYRFLLIGQVKQFDQIQLDRFNDDFLFPLTGAVALLGLDIREDFEHNTLVIRSVSEPGIPAQRRGGSFFHVGGLDYSYGLTTNGITYGQFANFRGEFLAGGIRMRTTVLLSRIPQRSFLGVTQGNIRADIAANQAVIVGDQAAYSGLEALSSSLRGLGHEAAFKGFRSYTYFGQAIGATIADGSFGLTRSDSTVAGINLQRLLKRGEWSLAAIHFDGPGRRGTTAGAAWRETRWKNQFLVQGLAGRGNGVVAANTFAPVQQFAITGRIERYSRNFLNAGQDSHFEPQITKSASMTVRPVRYITFNGSMTARNSLLVTQRTRSYSYGTSAVVPGPFPAQLGFFRSIQIDTASVLGRFTLDQYMLTLPDFGRFSFYTHYSKTLLPEEMVQTLTTTLGIQAGSRGRISLHDQLQFNKMRRYGADWMLPRGTDGFLRVGLDRVLAVTNQSGFSAVTSLRLPLPGHKSLEITYVGESHAHMLQFQFSGSARRDREVVRDARGQSALAVATPLAGRVYLDNDLNGSFEPATDTPIGEVPIWLDEQSASTDAAGQFRFDHVAAGPHTIRAELAGVPADLVFADIPERTIAVVPYQQNDVSFRVARAGRVLGVVTYADYTSDPDKAMQRPLPDARIIAGGDRDTFSEANGGFLLGDLTPATYELRLDPTTLPAGYVARPEVITVTVYPGESVQGVHFELAIPPRPVIERKLD